MLTIPILDRLTFRDYQGYFLCRSSLQTAKKTDDRRRLLLTILFFGFENVIRLIVTVLPSFVIRGIDAFIARQVPVQCLVSQR